MGRRNVAGALGEIDKRLEADTLLSAADREQIRKKAREHVEKKRRDEAEAKYLAESIREVEIEDRPTEQDEDILIDLAPFAPFVSLDGKMFFHGLIYTVPYSVARVLDDVSARTWEHQNEIDGKRRKGDVNRRPVLRRLGPSDAGSVVNTRNSVLDSNASI
jgi:hypothetical protein